MAGHLAWLAVLFSSSSSSSFQSGVSTTLITHALYPGRKMVTETFTPKHCP